MSELPEKPRPRIVWWARKMGEPLRETYQVETDTADQFIDLLAEADRRLGNNSSDQSEGA